ncbi:unnamed protein product (macronuclear) [Paramecium tetraurelia]|uniref:CSC1/OSCA1-like cytosolic domain-containing protein n=1 Tax=Paramecium tetraurelia TaxID=5888 RepID=A0BHJ5_PARTE|nr:uncharacterized protein GSPATT00029047001 [Paramecium tetraurelia]CAK58012.1 unnamed protein product [Paramecium tetraurelia]|eukprot:XP_001425410.1 hypothetical protein (macronuclear) [Paramecium tetraurelia strain d4-2]
MASRFIQNSFNQQESQRPSRAMSEHQKSKSEKGGQKVHHKSHASHHYNPLVIPCDWVLAENHAKARRVARELEVEYQSTCPCCGYSIERTDLEYDCDPLEMKFLGSGFPLFYMFIKYCIFILVEFWLLKGMFCLATDLMGDYCYNLEKVKVQEHAHHSIHDHLNQQHHHKHKSDNQICGGSLWHFVSLANVYDREDIRNLQSNLSLVVVFANMVSFLFFRKAQRSIDIEVDESQLTPSDYTICVKNIPNLNQDYKEVLKNIFQNYAADGRELTVTKIVLVYNLDEVIELEESLKEMIREKQEYLLENGMNFADFKVKQLDEKLESLEQKIHQKEHELFINKDKFAGIAFISFLTEEMKQLVLQHNPHTSWERIKAFFNNGLTGDVKEKGLIFEGHKLYVEEAPEPNDVDWEFIHIQTGQKVKARVIAWSISISFMAGCFFLIWFLSELAERMNEQVEEQEKKDNSIFNKLVYFLDCRIFQQVCNWKGVSFRQLIWRKYQIRLNSISVLLENSPVALFINTALISLVIDFYLTGNVIGKGGFIYNESNVFLLNAFIPPIVWFVDPWSIQKDYQRQKQQKNVKNCVLTQQEANEIMEMPDYSQAKRYGDIMKTMWFTFFYGDIIPLGILFSIMGLTLYYFVDKYNESLSKHLSIEMIEMLELIIIFTGIGNTVVSSILFGEVKWQDFIIIIIGIVYILLPMEDISSVLFPLEQKDEVQTYYEAEEHFNTDYDRENPVTRREILHEIAKKK